MNETIKTNTDSPRSSLLIKFFISSVVLLLVIYAKFYLHIRFYDIFIVFFKIMSIDLWFVGYNTLQQALEEVNGRSIPIVKFGTYLSMFFSFLFLFVVYPIVFIYFRKKINDNNLGQNKSVLIVRIVYFVILAILIGIPANTIASAIAQNSHFDVFKKTSVVQKYLFTDVRSELWKMVFKAQQYYILPVAEGGGGKSFLKNGKPVSLNDLGIEGETVLGRTILEQQKSDTLLRFHFFGNRIRSRNRSSDPDIVHVIDCEITVSPSDFWLVENY